MKEIASDPLRPDDPSWRQWEFDTEMMAKEPGATLEKAVSNAERGLTRFLHGPGAAR